MKYIGLVLGLLLPSLGLAAFPDCEAIAKQMLEEDMRINGWEGIKKIWKVEPYSNRSDDASVRGYFIIAETGSGEFVDAHLIFANLVDKPGVCTLVHERRDFGNYRY